MLYDTSLMAFNLKKTSMVEIALEHRWLHIDLDESWFMNDILIRKYGTAVFHFQYDICTICIFSHYDR